MIRDLGIVAPGTTLYLPFHTFDSNDPSASVTLTGLATTDIEVYKDGGVTQRGSDNGYALLDTDGIDFDGVTGIHGISIDLADNSTAGFWAAGSQYWVVISSVTVDAATINFVLATFRIGYAGSIIDTTIATLSTQTSFTLTAGPAEDDALNGCMVLIHDVASAVQKGFAVVSDYTGASKTVTLTAGTTFTAAATDNISFFAPANAAYGGAVAYSTTRGLAGTALPAAAAGAAGGIPVSAAGSLDLDAKIGALTYGTANRVNVQVYGMENNVVTAAAIATGAIDADAIAADAITDAKVASDVTIASVTGAVGSVTGNVGGNVTGTVGGFTTAAKAEIQTEAEDAIVAHRLDELLNADSDIDGAAPPTVGSVFHELMSKTAGSFTFDQTTDSCEALRDRGDAAWITATGFSTHSAADVWSVATRSLTVLDEDSTTLDLDATIRAAVGMASANFDTQVGDIPTNSELATAITTGLTTALTEGYRGTNATGSVRDLLYEIIAHMGECSISSTTKTLKKLDGSTTAKTFTLNSSSTPTSITEAT